jgi:hypothetical protein
MKKINIELTNDELIVLSDLINRLSDTDFLKTFYEDQAEERALWNLDTILEKNTAEIFNKNYSEILQIARSNLRDDD